MFPDWKRIEGGGASRRDGLPARAVVSLGTSRSEHVTSGSKVKDDEDSEDNDDSDVHHAVSGVLIYI